MTQKRRSRAIRDVALKQKKIHDKEMKGKVTKLIPHPIAPKTFIEVIVDE